MSLPHSSRWTALCWYVCVITFMKYDVPVSTYSPIHMTYTCSNKLAAQQPLDGSMLVYIINNIHL